MVELIINQNLVELPLTSRIKFTKQISDIFDLTQVACSYTNSFEFDKTPINTQAMQYAGISGDLSNVPYQKNTAQLKINGFDIVSNGWFNLLSMTENYKGSILDGVVDFFKLIENKTLGNDLDLTDFEHTKDLNSVIDSFENQHYRYLIADYGGKIIYQDGIDIDYLAPAFSVRKIWELIFSTFGFNCDYTNLSYIDDLWITYPKEIIQEGILDLVANLHKNNYVSTYRVTGGIFAYPIDKYFWDTAVVTEGNLLSDNWTYIIPETASYNFDLAIEMYASYHKSGYYDRRLNVSVLILKNGVIIGSLPSDYNEGDHVGDERTLNFNLGCDAGDKISLRIESLNRRDFNKKYFYLSEWHHNKTNFKIFKSNLGTTALGNELKDFAIKDFIKEIIWRTGLTPVYNRESNTMKFITLNSRIDFANAQDYSHTFIGRTGETYTNDYAQKNTFKLKNNVDTDSTGNGYLYVPNINLADEKIIVNSKIYAPDKRIVTSFGDFNTNQYKIWEAETKDNDGTLEIKYKGLSGRFYFLREKRITGEFKLISEILIDDQTVSEVPYAVNENTLFEEAVYSNYAEYQKIFINFRAHSITLNITEADFISLDLTRPVYFKQENAYYICNKIDFQEGQYSNGEFIKINKL